MTATLLRANGNRLGRTGSRVGGMQWMGFLSRVDAAWMYVRGMSRHATAMLTGRLRASSEEAPAKDPVAPLHQRWLHRRRPGGLGGFIPR